MEKPRDFASHSCMKRVLILLPSNRRRTSAVLLKVTSDGIRAAGLKVKQLHTHPAAPVIIFINAEFADRQRRFQGDTSVPWALSPETLLDISRIFHFHLSPGFIYNILCERLSHMPANIKLPS